MDPADRPTRRRVVYLNRFEDRAPGRLAYVVYRTRRGSRAGASRTYRQLAEYLQRREALLRSDTQSQSSNERSDGSEATRERLDSERRDEPPSEHASTPTSDRPDEEWTKGRLYELAQAYDLDGRSKLNKADLLAAVAAEWDQRNADA